MDKVSPVRVQSHSDLYVSDARALLAGSKARVFDFEGRLYVAPNPQQAIRQARDEMPLSRFMGSASSPERPDWSKMRELPAIEVTALRERAVELVVEADKDAARQLELLKIAKDASRLG